jgi:hypothetical protein
LLQEFPHEAVIELILAADDQCLLQRFSQASFRPLALARFECFMLSYSALLILVLGMPWTMAVFINRQVPPIGRPHHDTCREMDFPHVRQHARDLDFLQFPPCWIPTR